MISREFVDVMILREFVDMKIDISYLIEKTFSVRAREDDIARVRGSYPHAALARLYERGSSHLRLPCGLVVSLVWFSLVKLS